MSAATVVLIDQATKSLAVANLAPGVTKHIVGPLSLQLLYNHGLVSSIGNVSHGVSSATPLIAELIGCFLVTLLVLFTHGGVDRASGLGMGLFLGGGFGNLADRLFRPGGSVVDFIQLKTSAFVFNIADVALIIGFAVLAFDYTVIVIRVMRETSMEIQATHAKAVMLPTGDMQ
jgi:signal peptidase II